LVIGHWSLTIEIVALLGQRRNFSPGDWCGIIKLCITRLQCLHVCPTEAISEADDGLVVDEKKCWRCGRCERVCPEGAIQLEKRGEDEFQAALAEGTQAVLSTFEPGKVLYFNFALEVQSECDCMPMADTPLVQDQGILAEALGVDGQLHVDAAARIGLGLQEYELIKV
jgi:uncharacterized Fe-S center protein